MAQPTFSVDTPVRLLMRANREFDELKNRLEVNDRWKKLMLFLPRCHTVSDFGPDYVRKYTHDHVRLIEKAGSADKTCSEYLIDEWGTSTNGAPGIFPKIGDLIRFLVGAGLYIPAVYLAIDLLHDASLIVRPTFGPAALVDTTMNDPTSFDRMVADAGYPDNFENVNDSVLNRNLDHHQALTSRNVSIPLASPEPEPQPVFEPMSVSLAIPSLDSLLSPNSERLAPEPMLSDLLGSSSSESSELDSEPISGFNMPNMEVLNDETVGDISEPFIPNLSILGND